jgi:hypothetical protein
LPCFALETIKYMVIIIFKQQISVCKKLSVILRIKVEVTECYDKMEREWNMFMIMYVVQLIIYNFLIHIYIYI